MALVASNRVYSGRIFNLDHDTVRFPDGSTGMLEMIRHPGASAVVPFLDHPRDPDPRVALIRQFRHAADAVIWEIPAGRRDGDESFEACARRELEEEAGFAAGHLEHLVTVLTTPGFTDERIALFAAWDLTERIHRREADEFMDVHVLRWSEVLRLVREGAIGDAKTLSCLLFVHSFIR